MVATVSESRPSGLVTEVYISWNGDTEAATWNVLHTDPSGDVSELVTSTARTGFETKLEIDEYMRHIVAVALDVNGEEIGRSDVVTIHLPPELESPAVAAGEEGWLENHSSTGLAETTPSTDDAGASDLSLSMTGLIFFGVVGCVVLAILLRKRKQRWWNSREPVKYEAVAGEDKELERHGEAFDKEVTEPFNRDKRL